MAAAALWRWRPNTGNKYSVYVSENRDLENWPLNSNRGWPLNTGLLYMRSNVFKNILCCWLAVPSYKLFQTWAVLTKRK